jgi:hypothetical protein
MPDPTRPTRPAFRPAPLATASGQVILADHRAAAWYWLTAARRSRLRGMATEARKLLARAARSRLAAQLATAVPQGTPGTRELSASPYGPVECAWCRVEIRPGNPTLPTSHGICQGCERHMLDDTWTL